MSVPLAVTVAANHPGRYEAAARRKAAEWGVPFVRRLKPLPGEALLMLGARGWSLRDEEGSIAFAPGLAVVRIKRLRSGAQQQDNLVKLAELGPGDAVIDATFGLGADAMVCAHVVGPTGRMLGVEASLPLFALASEGLRSIPADSRTAEVLEGAAPIELRHGRAFDVLSTLPSASVDCVFFDPMFELPKAATASFALLRRYALHEPLDERTLAEARRVARRWVVVKGGRYGNDLQRLGLEPLRVARHSAVVWARVAGSEG